MSDIKHSSQASDGKDIMSELVSEGSIADGEKFTFTFSKSKILSLEASSLNNLIKELGALAGDVGAEVHYENGIVRELRHIEDCSEIVHNSTLEISRLKFHSGLYPERFYIEFKLGPFDTVVAYSNSSYDRIVLFQNMLESMLRNNRPWYSILASHPGKIFFGAPFFAFLCYGLFIELTGTNLADSDNQGEKVGAFSALALFFGLGGLMIAADTFVQKLFPKMIFSLDAMSGRKSNYDKLHITIATAVILPLLYGFLT